MVTLDGLLAETDLEIRSVSAAARPQRPVTAVTHDSRRVQPGALFVAASGHRADGHAFIPDAVARGAAAVVGERPASELSPELGSVPYVQVADGRVAVGALSAAFWGHPTRELATVAVTGTKGKTSVVHFSATALGRSRTAISSTVVNERDRGLEQTTLDAPTLQEMAHQALASGRTALALEASAHGLVQERLRGTDVDTAVFTNLSHDHFDYFATWDDYRAAKRRLFEDLRPTSTAVLNDDDPTSKDMARATRAEVLRYGLTPEADLWADIRTIRFHDTEVTAHTPWGSMPLRIRWPGEIYVRNALAALGVGLVHGVALATLRERLEAQERIDGRMARYRAPNGAWIVVDFAHSPDSLEQALRTLAPYGKRVIVVFGCGGDADRLKRPIMGRIAAHYADRAIATTDNPKSEAPEAILEAVAAGMPDGDEHDAILDRTEAIRKALELAGPDDLVLIAGKGHERTQALGHAEVPFSDEAVLDRFGARPFVPSEEDVAL